MAVQVNATVKDANMVLNVVQKYTVQLAESAIRKIRNTANVVYLNDPQILKDFHIGINIPHSVAAKLARDNALKELRRAIAKFRKIAKLCFSGSPEILNEFKKLPG